MPIPDSSEEYKPASVAELRNRRLNEMRLLYERIGIEDPDLGEGSDAYIRAEASARAEFAQYSQIAIARRDSSETTATGAALDDILEALGLPQLSPAGAAGVVVPVIQDGATVTFYDGVEFRLDSNKVGKVSGTQSGITNGATVTVIMTDSGVDTNAAEGDRIRFDAPPLYVEVEGTVGPGGLTGGTGEESDDDKRNRIKTRRQNIPGAGNAAHLIELAEAASTGIQKAFCHGGLGGPATQKVVLVSAISQTTPKDFSREVPDATVLLAEAAIEAVVSSGSEIIVQSAADELVDVTLQLDLPSASLGWVNATPWPQLVDADNGYVQIVIWTDPSIIVTAQTDIEPVDGSTSISVWDARNQEFKTSIVASHAGGPGGWTLDLETPLPTTTAGDFVSPTAKNMVAYGATFLDAMGLMGPGENTTNPYILANGRGYRFPKGSQNKRERFPKALTNVQITALLDAYTEIDDAIYAYRSLTEPTVPDTVEDAPNVLRLQNFAIYEKT